MAVAKPDEIEPQDVSQDEIPPEHLYKHPLHHTWVLWYFENEKNRNWEDCLREVISFETVEDFWSLFNHVKQPSELKVGSDYSLFKKGIRPMWEDKANIQGGRWVISLDRKQREFDLDHYWLETILCLIGEAFDDYGVDVCGAVVNIRGKGDKIAVWTADASKSRSECTIAIGKILKERLKIPLKSQICYQNHKDSMEKSSSVARSTYIV